MADGKRYYWLKLKDDFFTSRRMKKLRKIAGGDCYTIIYLKLQLLSLKTEGHLYYEGLEESFAAELALDIDEDAENVQMTMQFLVNTQLAELSQDGRELYLPWVTENTGSEGASAKRVRDYRQREQQRLLSETPPMLQSNTQALQCNNPVTERKSKRKEKELERDYSYPKSAEEVRIFLKSIRSEAAVDAQLFFDTNSACGWKNADGRPITDWKRYLCGIIKNGGEYNGHKPVSSTAVGEGRFDGINFYDA